MSRRVFSPVVVENDGAPTLFGEVWCYTKKRRGRPPHVKTAETCELAMKMYADGATHSAVAAALKISTITYDKYYLEIKEQSGDALIRAKSQVMDLLWQEAAKGKIAAIKELRRIIEKQEARNLGNQVRDQGLDAQPKQQMKLGKKEQQRQAASEVQGLYAPRRMN